MTKYNAHVQIILHTCIVLFNTLETALPTWSCNQLYKNFKNLIPYKGINISCTSFLMISLLSDSKSISLDTPSEHNEIKTKFLSIEDLINNSEEKKYLKHLQTIYFYS